MRARLRRAEDGPPSGSPVGDVAIDVPGAPGHPRRRADRADPAGVRPAGRAGPQAAPGVHPRGAARAGLGLPARGRHPAGERARPAAAVQDRADPEHPEVVAHRARRRVQGRDRPWSYALTRRRTPRSAWRVRRPALRSRSARWRPLAAAHLLAPLAAGPGGGPPHAVLSVVLVLGFVPDRSQITTGCSSQDGPRRAADRVGRGAPRGTQLGRLRPQPRALQQRELDDAIDRPDELPAGAGGTQPRASFRRLVLASTAGQRRLRVASGAARDVPAELRRASPTSAQVGYQYGTADSARHRRPRLVIGSRCAPRRPVRAVLPAVPADRRAATTGVDARAPCWSAASRWCCCWP